MKKFLNGLTILTTLLMGSMMMQSCDNDPLTIGDELVGAGATGSKLELDLILVVTTQYSNQKSPCLMRLKYIMELVLKLVCLWIILYLRI